MNSSPSRTPSPNRQLFPPMSLQKYIALFLQYEHDRHPGTTAQELESMIYLYTMLYEDYKQGPTIQNSPPVTQASHEQISQGQSSPGQFLQNQFPPPMPWMLSPTSPMTPFNVSGSHQYQPMPMFHPPMPLQMMLPYDNLPENEKTKLFQ